MLKETRERMQDSPLRDSMLRVIKKRLSTRIAIEAYRGMSMEEIQLRLSLDAQEAREIVDFGIEAGTLTETDGIVRKKAEEGAA